MLGREKRFARNTTSSQRKRSCTARCNWEACLPFVLGQKWVSGSADCLTDEKSNADEMFRYYHEIKLSALQTGGGASPPSFERSLLPGTPLQQRGATYQTYLEGRGGGWGEGIHTYLIHTYRPKRIFCKSRQARLQKCGETKKLRGTGIERKAQAKSATAA